MYSAGWTPAPCDGSPPMMACWTFPGWGHWPEDREREEVKGMVGCWELPAHAGQKLLKKSAGPKADRLKVSDPGSIDFDCFSESEKALGGTERDRWSFAR